MYRAGSLLRTSLKSDSRRALVFSTPLWSKLSAYKNVPLQNLNNPALPIQCLHDSFMRILFGESCLLLLILSLFQAYFICQKVSREDIPSQTTTVFQRLQAAATGNCGELACFAALYFGNQVRMPSVPPSCAKITLCEETEE